VPRPRTSFSAIRRCARASWLIPLIRLSSGSLFYSFNSPPSQHGLFLITAAHDANTDTKTLAALLNLSGANLRFADSALLEEVLGVKQGSVGPLALVNDAEKKCSFVIDKSLLDSDVINSHPLRNDRTTAVSSADLVTFIKACGHEPVILDFSSAPAAPAGGGSNNKKEKAKQKASAAPPTEKRGIVKPKVRFFSIASCMHFCVALSPPINLTDNICMVLARSSGRLS
jgi:hypothetical protein